MDPFPYLHLGLHLSNFNWSDLKAKFSFYFHVAFLLSIASALVKWLFV